MVNRKVFCEVVENIVYSDRCLYKLSKVIEGNKTCEGCILREFEEMESMKTKRSSDIEGKSDIKGIKIIKDIKGNRGKIGRGPEKKPKPIKNKGITQSYSSQELIELLGKPERTIRKWAAKGKVPAYKIGKKWHFPKEEIDRWLSEKGTLNLQRNDVFPTMNKDFQEEETHPPNQNEEGFL